METSKIIGYLLLVAGLALMIFTLYQSYSIFTGKTLPAQVFTKPVALQVDETASPLDVQKQMQNALIKIIPIDFINNTLNLGSWLLLMWIMIFGGGKIADIGVKMIK